MLLLVLFLASSIFVYGQTSAKEKLLTHNKAEDRYASYSPSGDQIIFESNRDGNWEIYIMDADGQNQRRVVASEFEDRRPGWYPNGKKVLFESNRNGKFELYELTLKGRKIKKIKIENMEGEPIFAQYSPNGKKIAFSLRKSENEANIAITDKKGTSLKLVTNFALRSFYPSWSADGNKLLFFSRHETENKDDEVYQINIDGTEKKRLTNWPKHNFCPRWSHDGKKIAYVTSMEGTRPEIYIMDANGKHQVRITYNENGDTLPNWSPDNKKLLTTCYRNGNYEICEITVPDLKE